jgi:translocation and assembly module TamB
MNANRLETEGDLPVAPPAVPDPGRPSRRPIMRGLRLLGGLLISVLLLVLVLAGLALGTQTGLRTALALAQALAPGTVRVGTAEGRVLGRLHLHDLEVHLPSLDLTLGDLELDWSPLAALAGTLPVRRLAARDIDLVLAPSEGSGAPLVLSDLAPPLNVQIEEAQVERLRVRERGAAEPVLDLDRAAFAASLDGSDLDLTRLELDLARPSLRVQAKGQARLAGAYPLGLDLDWSLDLPPAVALKGKGTIGGDLGHLTIEHQVSGSVRARLDLQVNNVLTAPGWDGQVELGGLDLPDFAAGAPDLEVKARLKTSGDLDAATVSGTLDGRATRLPDLGHLAARLDVRWQDRVLSIRTLDLKESISGARLAATGSLDLRPDPASIELKGDWERLRWPLSGPLLAESPKGQLRVSGTLARYDYSLSGQTQGPGFPAADLKLAGNGDDQGARIAELLVKTLGGRVQAKGALTWAPALGWTLEIRGQDLNPGLFVPGLDDRIALSLDTKGSLDAFGYDLAASTQGPGLPPARLALGGKGDLKGTVIDTLRLDARKGRIEGQAHAGWDPKLAWEADLKATGIDPGAYAPDWPGRIDGRIASQGSLEPDGPHLSLVLDGVQGSLRGYPIAAAGEVRMAGKSVQVAGLTASSGPSTARVDGTLDDTLDLTFDLASPDLASLLPQSKGSLQAKGQVRGTLKSPQVELELSAKDAEIAGQGIASLTGSADVSLTPDGAFRVQIDGTDLVLGAIAFDTLALRADGGMSNHRLSLALSGPELSSRIEAKGALGAGGAYRGSLTRLDLDQGAFGSWRLQRPMPIEVALPKAAAGPLCIRNKQGSGGCLQFDQTEAGQWTANIDLDKLGFELIQGFMPPNLLAEGAASLKGRFKAAGPVLTGSAVAQIPQGRLRMVMGGGRFEDLDLSGTRLSIDSSAKALSARLGLPLKGLGELAGNLELPGWRLDAPARPGQPLRGALRARVDGLARVANLVPDLTGATGSLDADLTLGGTIATPTVQGQAAARALGAEVPLIGLKVADGTVNLIAGKDRLDIQGQATVGGGRFELSGGFIQGTGGYSGRLLASGERLKVANTKEYFAVVTPRIQADLSPGGIRIGGEVVVPEARIRPRSIPAGTVRPSPDVVLADRAGPKKSALPVDIDLRLKLGDNVTIDAFGVRGRLAGDLRVFQAPGKLMLGDGQLGIVDGIYRLSGGFGLAAEIGAPLTIEQGRLVFAKTPIDNPGLLLQAQRQGGDTSAGVRVLGTLRDPKLAFFSESDPNMTQAEITKYLLTGMLPRRDSGNEDRSLSVGTYIRPKLYMEYDSAIGDRKDSVKLRYDLTRHIEVQTETGENPGADIFYSFENDWMSRKPASATGSK